MGNCFKRPILEEFADEASLLQDHNESQQNPVPDNRRFQNTQNFSDATSSDDEQSLFTRIFSSNRRRSNNLRSNNRNPFMSRHLGRRNNYLRQESINSLRRLEVQNQSRQNQNTEQNQILLAQRLGLIQHLPLVSWKSKQQVTNNTNSTLVILPIPNTSSSQNNQDESQNETQNSGQNQPSGSTSQSTSNNDTPPPYEKKDIFSSDLTASLENDKSSSDTDKSDCECTICMDEFEEGQNIRYLPCMHYYHQACIDDWLLRSFTCPRCMESVDSGIMASFAQQLS